MKRVNFLLVASAILFAGCSHSVTDRDAARHVSTTRICISLLWLFFFVFGGIISGCKDKSVKPVKPVELANLLLSPTAISLVYGGTPDSQQITATVLPKDATGVTYAWSSDNRNVAAVSSTGLVTAAGVGSTQITVIASDQIRKTAPVTVTAPKESPPELNSRMYVSPNGSNSNPGTLQLPFKSINYALTQANAGDTVFVRNGTYIGRVRFPKSGQAGRGITLKAYPGEKPLISGEGLQPEGYDALLRISGVSYITVEGFEIARFQNSKPAPLTIPDGITVEAGANNIAIRRNHVHHIENNVLFSQGRQAHAIHIIGNNSIKMHDIVVEDNEIHDCMTGTSETLTINGDVDGFIVRGNKIYNCEMIGIVAAGGYAANSIPEFNYVRNGLISENEVFNIENKRGLKDEYGAIGIYVDGARNIIVERNSVYNCDRGIGLVSETDGYPTSNCIARNNLVYDCWNAGIYIGGYLGYTGAGTIDCYIVNNTLYQNCKVRGYFGEIEGEIRLTNDCHHNFILNNLIYSGQDDLFVHKYDSSGSNNTFDNNLYDGPADWLWGSTNGTRITSFSEWKTACGGDANAIYGADPQLANPSNGDFSISNASPAKNAGTVSSNVFGDKDFAGNPRIVAGKISIGAFQ